MRIAFLGDISLNDKYIEMYKEKINPFENIYSKLLQCDYVIGNLENTCKGSRLSPKPLPKLFTTCETLDYLRMIPVNVVSLANNHAGDNYEEGFKLTIDRLQELNIKYLGAGFKEKDVKKPFVINNLNTSIALINYYGTDFKNVVPPDCNIKVNLYDKNEMLSLIDRLRKSVDHIILLIHWGAKVEGGYFPDYYMFNDSKDFIEAGCRLIIGHHSHTFQPYEVKNNGYVFYSLGNFCFSNYTYNGRTSYLERRNNKSGIPVFEVDKENFTLREIFYFENILNQIEILNYVPFRFTINNSLFKIIKLKPIWRLYFLYLKRFDWIFKMFFRSPKPLSHVLNDFTKINMIKRGLKKLIGASLIILICIFNLQHFV